ncbi:MAG: TonB-dependent receptor [Pseudomonadota bacterium]
MALGTAHAADETTIEEVVVTAHPLSAEGLAQPVEILEGDDLALAATGDIGSTLGALPGIHGAPFGKAAGRPVIRGLGGPRVKVMEDRIDALDVSVTSADHAVTVDPFIAERIEILKGSAALLYGSGAIGGVVDVHTGRIPHNVPEDAFAGGIETRLDSSDDGNVTVAKFDGGAGNFAWHLDATFKDGDEYDIPGFAESSRQRAMEEEEEHEEGEEEEHEEEEEARDSLPGSQYDSKSYAGGISYVGDWGFIGVAVSRIDSEYGLPGGHGHHEEEEGEEHEEEEHEEEEEGEGNPILEMEQTRTDIELGINDPFGNFTSLNVRLGINNYEHIEFEPNGEAGTVFDNEAYELRTELVYDGNDWQGAIGVQYADREFSAIGEEAFVPPVDTTEWGAFWVGERSFDGFDLEAGLRIGGVDHSPTGNTDESFNTYAGSLGAVIPVSETTDVGLLLDVSQRAPIGEELYSDGPHLATATFEIGDPGLSEERALALTATANHSGENWGASASVYFMQFADFIYQSPTGGEEDELPVFLWAQDDASFFGIDAQVHREFALGDNVDLQARLMFDLVNAEVDVSGNDNLPRIPPARYGAGFDLSWANTVVTLDFMRVTEQDEAADFELETDAYNDLSLSIVTSFDMGGSTLQIFAHGRNLTDDEQRLHTSFIKDFAPQAGRRYEAGLRLNF